MNSWPAVTTMFCVLGLLVRLSTGGLYSRYGSRYRSRPRSGLLSMWIDEHQMGELSGYSRKISIVQDGVVASYFKNKAFFESLPELPPAIDIVRLNWVDRLGQYKYWFRHLKSTYPDVLYSPLLSIPVNGSIPNKQTEFQIAIPCTGKRSGVSPFEIDVYIFRQNIPINGSPIRLRLRKRCNALKNGKTSRSICSFACLNGGICSRQRTCICQQGYTGRVCEIPVCSPTCENNGTCLSPGRCRCKNGFTGSRCEKVRCVKPCYNGRRCAGPEACPCPKGYTGYNCQEGLCDYTCSNGGTCVSKNNCLCQYGYVGALCEIPLCRHPCGRHGLCVAVGVCQCEIGWYGRHCNKRLKGKGRRHRKWRKERRKHKRRNSKG